MKKTLFLCALIGLLVWAVCWYVYRPHPGTSVSLAGGCTTKPMVNCDVPYFISGGPNIYVNKVIEGSSLNWCVQSEITGVTASFVFQPDPSSTCQGISPFNSSTTTTPPIQQGSVTLGSGPVKNGAGTPPTGYLPCYHYIIKCAAPPGKRFPDGQTEHIIDPIIDVPPHGEDGGH